MEVEILKKLRTKQYEHFESFTLLNKDEFNMDSIPASSKILLAKKVGYGMFGLPKHPQHITQLPSFVSTLSAAASTLSSRFQSSVASKHGAITASTGHENASTGYSREQESKIWPVVEKIINLSPTDIVKLSCTFLVYHENNYIINVPIFRVQASKGIVFLDSNCREYNNLNDLLNNNTLPDVVFCYPLNGWYDKANGFQVAFSSAPASKPAAKELETRDTVGKYVSFVAGGAGFAVFCGVVTPFVAPIAILGGIAGGAYGAVRGVQKIMDKKSHGEPVKIKDVFNVAANCLSVVGAAGMAATPLMAVTAEGAAIIFGTRAVAGVSGVTSTLAFLLSTNDTPPLINLIIEVEDSSLKMWFYFGTANSKDTLSHIRKSLKLEGNTNTVETLMALLKNNCNQFATGNEEVRFEKYVSQSTAELVASILTTISSDVGDVVKYYCDFLSIFQEYEGKMTSKEKMAEEVDRTMKKLLEKLNEEVEVCKEQLVNIMCQNQEMLSEGILLNKILDLMDSGEGIYLVLAFRFLIWSFISEIRKANYFINSIEHEAVTLKDHYLGDVRCHPLDEISRQVKERVQQIECAVEFKAIDTKEQEYFVLKVLNLVKQISKKNWSVHQFVGCIINITNEVVLSFGRIINLHKKLVDKKGKVSCKNLETLPEELGLEGYSYGSWVSKKVMNELKVDVDAIENMVKDRPKTLNFEILPAWGGVLDDLYHYHTKLQDIKKFDLIKQIENLHEVYYSALELNDGLSIFTPCDKDSLLPTFVVFYYKGQHNGGEGFIWINKKEQRTQEHIPEKEEECS